MSRKAEKEDKVESFCIGCGAVLLASVIIIAVSIFWEFYVSNWLVFDVVILIIAVSFHILEYKKPAFMFLVILVILSIVLGNTLLSNGTVYNEPQGNEETITKDWRFKSKTVEAEKAKEKIYMQRLEELKSIRRNKFESLQTQRRESFEKECQRLIDIENTRRAEIEATSQKLDADLEKIAEDEAKRTKFTDTLREFALKESPALWETIHTIKAEIQTCDEQIEKYKNVSQMRNTDYAKDPAFIKSCKMRNLLARSLRSMMDHLNEAYVMKKRFEATPMQGTYTNLMNKAIEDGVIEARMIIGKYDELKKGVNGK